jgi:hypothetical protein
MEIVYVNGQTCDADKQADLSRPSATLPDAERD